MSIVKQSLELSRRLHLGAIHEARVLAEKVCEENPESEAAQDLLERLFILDIREETREKVWEDFKVVQEWNSLGSKNDTPNIL